MIGQTQLWITDNASTTASIDPRWTAADHAEGQRNFAIHICTTTLAAEITKYGIPSFIKVDVEGHELAVIRGLDRPVPAISIEYHHHPDDIRKTNLCIAELYRMGFSYVQATLGESPRFAWTDWLPIQSLMPCAQQSLPRSDRCGFGDLFFIRHRRHHQS